VTHKDLVKKARAWLRQVAKCSVIVTERASTNSPEIPDAIGWKSARHSILIECKASRADFRKDADKWFRLKDTGMGQSRYYMAPHGIIPKDEVPPGWGLLEVVGPLVKVTIECDLLCMDEMRCWAEMPLLIAVVRRLQYQNSELRREVRKIKKAKGR
jgi:hypothetical protein